MSALSTRILIVAGGALVVAAALPGIGVSAPTRVPVKPPAQFVRCAICHANTSDGTAEIGPNLFGVSGSKAGSRPGFGYSAGLKKSGLVWTKANLARFIANPAATAPGTTMPNPNIAAPADRDAIAAYLVTLK